MINFKVKFLKTIHIMIVKWQCKSKFFSLTAYYISPNNQDQSTSQKNIYWYWCNYINSTFVSLLNIPLVKNINATILTQENDKLQTLVWYVVNGICVDVSCWCLI